MVSNFLGPVHSNHSSVDEGIPGVPRELYIHWQAEGEWRAVMIEENRRDNSKFNDSVMEYVQLQAKPYLAEQARIAESVGRKK